MLLDDNVMSDGQAEAGALSSRFCREEGIEHLFPNLRRNARTVIANADFDAVAEVLRPSGKSRFMAIAIVLLFALGRCIEAVRDQVQKCPRDLLRVHIDLTGGR